MYLAAIVGVSRPKSADRNGEIAESGSQDGGYRTFDDGCWDGNKRFKM